MEELIKLMSNEDLEAMLVKYKGNESVEKLIKGILETRKVEAEKAQIKLDFEAALSTLLISKEVYPDKKKETNAIMTGLPKPPESIHNVFLSWQEVEVETGPAVEVEVVKDGQKVKEMRTPTTKVWQWKVETNKALEVKSGKSSTGESGKITKRAITIYKREGLNLKLIGNFTNAAEGCKFLKLDPAGDSANRVLIREGCVVEPYTGTEFTKIA